MIYSANDVVGANAANDWRQWLAPSIGITSTIGTTDLIPPITIGDYHWRQSLASINSLHDSGEDYVTRDSVVSLNSHQ